MSTLEDRKVLRFKLLKALVESANEREDVIIDMWQVGEAAGLSQDDTITTAQYLVGEGWLEFLAIGGGVGLTHAGLIAYYDAMKSPETPTRELPAAITVIGNVVNSQIQQGTTGSTQLNFAETKDVVTLAREITETLRQCISSLSVSKEEVRNLEAHLSSLEAQLRAPTPNRPILTAGLKAVREILQSAVPLAGAASAAASALSKLHGLP